MYGTAVAPQPGGAFNLACAPATAAKRDHTAAGFNRRGRRAISQRSERPQRTMNRSERYCAFGAEDGASAALGSGAGLSDFVLRKLITSARSEPRERPAKLIEVPGM
jgi:hypothetical protein